MNKKLLYKKYFFFIKFPVTFIQHLTIHWAEEGKYFKPFFVLNPLFYSALLCIVFKKLIFNVDTSHFPGFLSYIPFPFYIMAIGLLLSVLVFFTSPNNFRAPFYEPLFIFLGLITSAMWIYLIANDLVELLKTLGHVIGVADSIMGLTVLAWGNSIGDFISNIIIARKGYGQMAMSACYASPFTNLMVGLGIPIIVKIIGPPYHRYYIIDEDLLDNVLLLAFATALLNLILSLVITGAFKFKLTKAFGVFLIILYVSFTTLSILIDRQVLLTESLWKKFSFIN